MVRPAERRLLLLLHQIAQSAAAGSRNIRQAVALEVVLGSQVGALHRERDPVAADAAGGADQQALFGFNKHAIVYLWGWCAYRSIDGLIPGQVDILPKPVMGFSKCHAGKAVCHAAQVDRGEAAEEGFMPWLGGRGRLGVDDLARLGEDHVEAVLPLGDVVVVDGAGGWGWGRHYDGERVC